MKHWGVDPGKTGGIVSINDAGKVEYFEIPKIGTEVDFQALSDIFENIAKEPHFLVLEDVHAVPKAGAMQSFNFGQILGAKKALLSAFKIRHTMVQPKAWQKLIWTGIPNMKKSDGKNDTKAMSYLAFQRLFPNEKVAKSKDGLIDAALMAMYSKLTYKIA